ncbi:hypothetical protein [Pseudoxanthomonas sp. CF125]|uniref:hypothetical protein n=1 Tax=Pseudoxanthomonas sp. CF125 TaxID=1855303 RepID=UPI000891EB78|nr:hypothetical protein [Pseudoxanthomonas sp. CF125]SDQ39579.1 hypothetical protein SAMN05216569_0958 [Pseudoxanthomonas sp. CF125]
MNISFRTFCLLALTVASAVACKREDPVAAPQPAAVATPAGAPEANPVDATSVVDNTPAATEAATVDSKAIAGSFSDGESVLELRADGSYVQTLNAAGVAVSSDGAWSGHGGNGLLLDPSSKSAEDVSFEIVSNDELRTDKGTRVFKRVAGR